MPRRPRRVSTHVRYVTVGQAALVAGLERATIKAAFDDGRIPSAPLPGDVKRVRRARTVDVRAFVAQLEAALTGGMQ